MELLQNVLALDPSEAANEDSETVQHARDLIARCLHGDPGCRPSVEQILAHPFFTPGAPRPTPQVRRYHAFISHYQLEASGTVGTLFHSYRQLGVSNWVDMHMKDLTTDSMLKGVQDSDIFLLVLTKGVLQRPFCQLELREAIKLKKRVQLLLEVDPRFDAFDEEAWGRRELSSDHGSVHPQVVAEI